MTRLMGAAKLTASQLNLPQGSASDKKQGVALKGRNRTGPPWSVGRPTAYASGAPIVHAPGGLQARPPAVLQTTTTTTDTSDR